MPAHSPPTPMPAVLAASRHPSVSHVLHRGIAMPSRARFSWGSRVVRPAASTYPPRSLLSFVHRNTPSGRLWFRDPGLHGRKWAIDKSNLIFHGLADLGQLLGHHHAWSTPSGIEVHQDLPNPCNVSMLDLSNRCFGSLHIPSLGRGPHAKSDHNGI